MGLLDRFDTLSDNAQQYALNALARFGNGVGNAVQAIPGKIQAIPGNAQKLGQELRAMPQQIGQTFSTKPGGLFDPNGNKQLAAALRNPQQANPQQWMDQGMALAGMAPVTAPVGMFIGQGAKTWDAIAAQHADDLLKQGIDPREVWKQTGTLKGVDGALRQEIPDNLAKYDPEALADLKAWPEFNYKSDTQPLGGVIEHKKLFSAYPDAEDIPVHFMPKQNMKEAFGSYSNKHDRITLADLAGDQTSPALHEIQHAIQQREGWDIGGNPLDFSHLTPDVVNDAQILQARIDRGEAPSQAAKWMKENLGRGPSIHAMDIATSGQAFKGPTSPNDAYRRLAGEAEARLTQSRMGLDAAQRLQHYPYDMGQYGLDVPMDQLIVRGR